MPAANRAPPPAVALPRRHDPPPCPGAGNPRASKTFGETGLLDRVLAVGPGDLSAQARRRQHLAGIAETLWIDRVAQLLHHVEIVGGKHPRHVVLLVRADAMLTGNRPAGLDTVLQNLSGDLLGERRLPRNALVVADQRMQIAVAGVEDIADAQAG